MELKRDRLKELMPFSPSDIIPPTELGHKTQRVPALPTPKRQPTQSSHPYGGRNIPTDSSTNSSHPDGRRNSAARESADDSVTREDVFSRLSAAALRVGHQINRSSTQLGSALLPTATAVHSRTAAAPMSGRRPVVESGEL